jgi:thymidine phosphorylase
VGQPLVTLHTDTPERFPWALQALDGGVVVVPAGEAPAPPPLVHERVTA